MAVRTFAAIDVGSFELELGIYEMTYKTGIRRIDHVRHVIALGKDTYSTGKISYELVEERGPDHDKTFVVQVKINSNVIGHGEGKSKKAAEQMAAKEAVELMGE